MDNIDDLKTDANIAAILKKLKDTSKDSKKDNSNSKTEDAAPTAVAKSLEVPAKEIPVENVTNSEVSQENNTSVNNSTEECSFAEDDILPWFSKADKDINLLHYIIMNDSGNLEYCSIKTDRPAESIASLKIKPEYLCDVDYYKSKHYVLYVKQLESDYSYSRLYTPESKQVSDNITVDDTQIVSDDVATNESATTNPVLVKTTSDDLTATVACSDKYNHYVVFTDLGIADFIAKADEVTCPCCSPDLNMWFEQVSNHIKLKNPNYDANKRVISDAASSVRDFKYDIVTMHRPGVITLDSVDNNDSDYRVCIKLKDEYSFLPMNRILGCLKNFATNNNKGTDDFRRFINRYFDIIV